LLKRMMLRVASKLADELDIDALVTGEAVAQVSSQTLANLAVINKVSETLVLRPLIMSEKQDIIYLAKKLVLKSFQQSYRNTAVLYQSDRPPRHMNTGLRKKKQALIFQFLKAR
jgi:thiamine biosynthesis protein ThiI